MVTRRSVVGRPLAGVAVGRVTPLLRIPVARDSELLLGAAFAVTAIAVLLMATAAVHQDTWLGFVAGRDIAHLGVPGHETLTSLAAGRHWVDEQWLSQLSMYALVTAGGIGLVAVVNALLVTSGLVGAGLAAVRLGARPEAILRVLPLSAAMVLTGSEIRTQPYGYPMFAATVFLLARDSRRPGRLVYATLPILALWGNVHGSASLGAGLVVLRGLTMLWERRAMLRTGIGSWARPAALIGGAPLCLLATPYGPSMASYYHSTLLNGSFRKFVTEWQPITAFPVLAVIFFVGAAIVVWSFGRHARQTTLWERLAVLALAALAIMALRNVQWFGLALLTVLPLSIEGAVSSRARPSRARLNVGVAGVAAIVLLAALALTLGRGDRAFEAPYPEGALGAVRAATSGPRTVRVLADEKFADWLLWRLPRLRGRVAYDARFELLSTRQITRLAHFHFATGLDWKRAADGYRLLVLDPDSTPDAVKAFERESGRRVLYRHAGVIVILRAA